ncbi:MAG: glycosyltransferase family 4 protein [Planctomycetota bacterium]|nr:glycosyltransferase family 4 protein [Planctomycetota bacterium]
MAVYTRLLMGGLTQAGIRHPLITAAEPVPGVLPETELPNVQVVRSLFWTSLRPFVFRKLVAWARAHDTALIHGLSAVAAPLCAKLAQALEVPYVVTVHHFQKRGALRPEHRCGGFIAVSESLRENLVNDAHVPKELIRLIPTGVRVPGAPTARPAVGQPGAAGAVPLVSSFGKLIPRKDYHCFLKAARLIVDKLGSECSFVIAGDGPTESALRKLARELGIAKQVTFCHGAIAHEAVLADTDVYVQCSRGEGFGTMALLAMAQGVPVVATSTGGLLTLVRDGETGFLVPVGDHQALADRVLKLLTDHELRRRCGDAARSIALADFNLDQMLSRTIALYSEALGTPARG